MALGSIISGLGSVWVLAFIPLHAMSTGASEQFIADRVCMEHRKLGTDSFGTSRRSHRENYLK